LPCFETNFRISEDHFKMRHLDFVYFLYLNIIFVVSFGETIFKSNKIVELSTGKIEGYQYRSKSGLLAYVFQGIPYAEAPVGDLRFAKTVPMKPWHHEKGSVLQCKSYQKSCPQNISLSIHPNQSEDCLFLNVFADVKCMDDKSSTVWFSRSAIFRCKYTLLLSRVEHKSITYQQHHAK